MYDVPFQHFWCRISKGNELMKLVLLLTTVGLLLYGFLNGIRSIVLFGAILFIVTLSLDLILIYRSAKNYVNESTWTESYKSRGVVKFLEKTLEGIIIIAGLLALIISQDDDSFGLFAPGAIIWIGTILIWFLGGIIVGQITGIPLGFGYGGWYIKRSRQHRNSNNFKKTKV